MDLKNLSTQQIAQELKRREDAVSNQRKSYKGLVEDQIPNLIGSLKSASEILSETKTLVYKELETLMQLKEELYGVKSNQRSHTFSTKKGESIEVGYRVTDGWDDTVTAGEAKVAEFISSLATNPEAAKLVKTINRLLKKDSNNNFNIRRVLDLKSMAEDYGSQLFNDGVQIILDAHRPKFSVFYIKASYKDANGRERYVPLTISAVEFTEEIDLSIFKIEDDANEDKAA